ncbi:MAG: nitroreductase family protein [Thaumarchaeota archaeon]|nr:nitroreductase family protein [Nitrososphaerota archaeon]
MDTYECIATKLDFAEFGPNEVSPEIVRKVLDAGRLTGSGNNMQHWRFILVHDPQNLKTLAADSTSGKWVAIANFAVIILTNPKLGFHLIDAGRAAQDMQLAAWNYGIASRIFTGIDKSALQKDFGIPSDLQPSAVLGFGYPARKILGKKKRKPLTEIAFSEKYGQAIRL